MPLPVDFYARPTLAVARDLLGCLLVHETAAGLVAGLIVETEAYIGADDPACHAARGRTVANASMWASPGVAYVYRSYGIHWMLNLVTERSDFPAAVLIRAAEPLIGLALLAERCAGQRRRDWLVGPGRLTRGLAIDGHQDGLPVTAGALTLRPGVTLADDRIAVSSRIGISQGRERLWRLLVAGHPSVSARAVASQPYRVASPQPLGAGGR